MKSIIFFDTEIDPRNKRVVDFGGIKENESFYHQSSRTGFFKFAKGTQYICGHNIIDHDLKYIGEGFKEAGFDPKNVIDTLYLSPLLFPKKPYHHLVKDEKLQVDELNNPLADSRKARDLFYEEVLAFQDLDVDLQKIFFLLLRNKKEFRGFFRYLEFESSEKRVEEIIQNKFRDRICHYAALPKLIQQNPVALAYALALIQTEDQDSITPPWVIYKYADVESFIYLLRNKPCSSGCTYCDKALDIKQGLKDFFGYDNFRDYGGKPLQEEAVQTAVNNESLLAIFPTGGGKSLAFQLPALMSGRNERGLTVVISPLQSLMKDQVDNLVKRGITRAVTINGLLNPIERAKAFEQVQEGMASLLYISPESLRSKSIEYLLLRRNVVRFVVDEAHCLSSWGQDFRIDYLYIDKFIHGYLAKKGLHRRIPVSCFTATAEPRVVEDILAYFSKNLNLELKIFKANVARKNLEFKVFKKVDEEEKYQTLRNLIEAKNCPTIVYVSRTYRATKLARRLSKDGFLARAYHGKMDKEEKKINQDSFINNETQIIVATSAFGMGVDKDNVGLVIHFEISDSLENYLQEAGRAGRDPGISADCYVLFDEEDLGKHFILLNQTKLTIVEIKQIWRAIKRLTTYREKISNSALEIARRAGWDDQIYEIETRVTTAVGALEEAGYLVRGQNNPRIFATSILSKTAQEAIDKIHKSPKFTENQRVQATRIIKKLFSARSRKMDEEETGESRVDYISDQLGIVKERVITIINLLREEKILADKMDLTAFIKNRSQKNHSQKILETFLQIEEFLLTRLEEKKVIFNLKELNEEAIHNGYDEPTTKNIKTILIFWALKNWASHKKKHPPGNYYVVYRRLPLEDLKRNLIKRKKLASFILKYLFTAAEVKKQKNSKDTQEPHILVEFSVVGLKESYEKQIKIFKESISHKDVEDALFYLAKIEAIKIEGGFMVLYNAITIERLEKNTRKDYTKKDYESLGRFYENKAQKIHIAGEYARRMIEDYRNALAYVNDYFEMDYREFVRKYFPGSKADLLNLRMTRSKFEEIFQNLSPAQSLIIQDNKSQFINILAGPGSGKTRVLVHKMASLLLTENVKQEDLLMLTFSRAAASEFKKRLLDIVGNAANHVDIKTFHSFCFDVLGRVGSLEKLDGIIEETVKRIKSNEVETNRFTKSVLLIDEAQDINATEFALIETLMEANKDMRVIAVGDDDQNIFEFRNASSKYMNKLMELPDAKRFELLDNFRSKNNLVEFSNRFLETIASRLKAQPISAKTLDDGQVEINRYNSLNLEEALVNDVINKTLTGTTCILTSRNREAALINGLLTKRGKQSKLIQSDNRFRFSDLREVRFLKEEVLSPENAYIITREKWEATKRILQEKFADSHKLDLCLKVMHEFETVQPTRMYQSDFESFINESNIEDFIEENKETIYVSTIHKAKGKEFDNVFIMLDDFSVNSDEKRRQIYVAMTRAKTNLYLHVNIPVFDRLYIGDLERVTLIRDFGKYHLPSHLSLLLTHRDIWLDGFIRNQSLISDLHCGMDLKADSKGCLTEKGQRMLFFSESFRQKISNLEKQGYTLKKASINHIIYWYKQEMDKEFMVVLPQVYLTDKR